MIKTKTKPDRPRGRFLIELEGLDEALLDQYPNDNYYVVRIDSKTLGGDCTYSIVQVSEFEYVDWVQQWYHYYRAYKIKHPVKYYRAKQLWMQYQPKRP